MITLLLACQEEAKRDTSVPAQDADSGAVDTAAVDTGLADSSCAPEQALLSGACASCHGETALGGLDIRRIDLLGGVYSTQLPELLLLAPGAREDSYLWHKLQGTHLDIGGTGQQMPPSGGLGADALEAIGLWIDDGASCDPEEVEDEDALASTYDPNTLDQDALFASCDGGPVSSQARIRRLDDVEWRSTIGHSDGSPAASNPLGAPSSARFSTYQDGVGMDAASLDLYLNVAHYAGGGWTAQYPEPAYSRQYQPQSDADIRCIYTSAEPDAECVEGFVRAFLENGAYFRPPTDEEVARLVAFADEAFALAAAEGWSRQETLSHVTTAAWLTPAALFPTELGDGAADADGRVRLTDWEHARLISNLIDDRALGSQGVFRWDLGEHSNYTEPVEGSMPDLQAAAADGSIRDPAVAGALLRQYAGGYDEARSDTFLDWGNSSRSTARSDEWLSSRIDRFFQEWLEVEDFPILFKDTHTATSAYEDNDYNFTVSWGNLQSGFYGHEPLMLQLLEDTIARVVVEDQDVLGELLTTRRFYLASTTRYAGTSIYRGTDYTNLAFDYTEDVGEDSPEDRWVELPADQRAGVLTHPAWLAAHGDAFEDGPSLVSRGRWIRESLLCETVPPLEFVTVPALLEESDGTKTARERVAESIEGRSECMVCHQSMNSLGAAFEIYNHAGVLRVDDHGHAPDGSTVVDNAPDPALNASYDDAIALSEALAESDYVKRCFVRQTFRFFAGRDETMADSCVLSAMEAAYDDNGGSFLSMLEVLATHDSTVYRHITEEEH